MSDLPPGITLKDLLTELVEHYGFEELGRRIPIRCFQHDPSIASSLRFLRRTPWARTKVERLYVGHHVKAAKKARRNRARAERRAMAATMPVERDDTLAFFWPLGRQVEPVPLPDGYTVVHGIDAEVLDQVLSNASVDIGEQRGAPLVAMSAVHGPDGPVAVACAAPRPSDWVELCCVAVAVPERARGLGRAVCADLVGQLLEEEVTRIVGSTADDRLHALRIALGLGFRPAAREGKEARWTKVLARLGYADA